MEHSIELNDVTKQYPACTAVDHLTLCIRKGERFGLLGPNGAGKSTTVSMLSTVLAPTSGTIRICGMDLRKQPRAIKQRMAIVPQDLALYQTLNAKDNLAFFGALYGLSGAELKTRVQEVLDITRLQEKVAEPVQTYSGGMKRRLNIGVALMNMPEILVLDEPTVGIDPQSRNHILETVRMLNRERGMTVVYTTHYMEEVESLCTRVGIMDGGTLKALGTLDELKQGAHILDVLSITCNGTEENLCAFRTNLSAVPGVTKMEWEGNELRLLLTPENADGFEILSALKAQGLPIARFHFKQASLEDVFLQITGKSLRE